MVVKKGVIKEILEEPEESYSKTATVTLDSRGQYLVRFPKKVAKYFGLEQDDKVLFEFSKNGYKITVKKNDS